METWKEIWMAITKTRFFKQYDQGRFSITGEQEEPKILTPLKSHQHHRSYRWRLQSGNIAPLGPEQQGASYGLTNGADNAGRPGGSPVGFARGGTTRPVGPVPQG